MNQILRSATRWKACCLTGLTLAFGLGGCTTVPSLKPDPVSAESLWLQEPEILEPVDTDFSDALAHFALGLSHEMKAETPAAIDQYLKAIEKDPDNDNLYILATRRLVNQGQKEAAYGLLYELLSRNPDNLRALRWTAHLHLQDQEPEKALTLLQRALTQNPPAESVYLTTIKVLLESNQLEEALDVGRQGILHAEEPMKVMRLTAQLLLNLAEQADDLAQNLSRRDEAEEILRNGADQFPEEDWFAFKTAELLISEGNTAEAFKRYVLLDKHSDDSSEIRARILLHAVRSIGSGQTAVITLREFLEEPENETYLTLYLLGLLDELSGRNLLALKSFESAIKRMPDDQATQRKLAVLYYQNEQPARASKQLDDVLRNNPEDSEILTLAGQLQLAAGNFEKAEQHFRKILVLSKQGEQIENLTEIQLRLAMAYLARGKEEEAVDTIVPVLQQAPDALELIWGHQMRLAIGDREEDPERAEKREKLMLEALMDLSDRLPDQPLIEVYIGITYNFKNEYTLAIQAFERARDLATDKENPSVWLTVDFYFDWAIALERTGKIDEAIETFERVIRLQPDHHRALNYVAYVWAERGVELEKAEDYVRKALQLDPGNGSYLDTLGWVYFQQGKFKDALRELILASEADPNEPVIVEHLGDVMLKLNRPVEAAGYYRIVLDMNAGDRVDIVKESLQAAEELIFNGLTVPQD